MFMVNIKGCIQLKCLAKGLQIITLLLALCLMYRALDVCHNTHMAHFVN